MISIPDKAGLARLRLARDAAEPFREGNVITLPSTTLTFLPLKKGQQFLAGPGNYSWQLFFGGTDEQPFLVQVTPSLREVLEKQGEEAFYQALKPQRVRDYEQRTGRAALRQGDIFAYPCTEWANLNPENPEIKRALKLILGVDLEMEKTDTSMSDCRNSPARVFETRHILHGFIWPRWQNERWWIQEPGKCQEPQRWNMRPNLDPVYATGVLEAPDHTDLVLEGVHVVTKAVGILGDPWAID